MLKSHGILLSILMALFATLTLCTLMAYLYRLLGKVRYIQGGPERMEHFRAIISRKRGTEWKSCVHYCVWNSFSSKMTPRSLILMKVFWLYGRFSEAMSFSRFALLSQKSQFTYRKCSIVWHPRVKCLLLICKAKPAWIKIKHSLRNFAALESGELLKEILPYLRRDFWYKRCNFENDIASENGSRIKTPSSKLTILVSSCWKKNFIHNNAHNFFILSIVFLKLLIVSVAFFLGLVFEPFHNTESVISLY